MIVSADISNFRGFTEARLSGLKTINIIVGDNGAGKTALLESIFIASASGPEALNRVRNWRVGSAMLSALNPASAYSAIWGDFFPNGDIKKHVRIDLKGSKDDTRLFQMFQAKGPAELPLSDTGTGEPIERPVTFKWEPPGLPPTEITPTVHGAAIMIPNPQDETNINGSFLGARQPVYAQEIASFYSDMRKQGKSAPFDELMKSIFDQIESLSVEIDGGASFIHAKIHDVSRLQPLHLVSDGINRVAQILLNIAARSGGLVCVDEIDSGLYFARQKAFWQAVRRFCVSTGTEIFASTHSLEALRALVPAMRDCPDHFTLIRVYRQEGRSRVAMVSGEDGLALIESGLEVR